MTRRCEICGTKLVSKQVNTCSRRCRDIRRYRLDRDEAAIEAAEREALAELRPNEWKPTAEAVGSEGRIGVYASRLAAGLPLWHPDDSIRIHDSQLTQTEGAAP